MQPDNEACVRAPDAGPETDGLRPHARHQIVAGAALIAALAGFGVTALDYPWHMGNGRRMSRQAPPAATIPAPPATAPTASAPPETAPVRAESGPRRVKEAPVRRAAALDAVAANAAAGRPPAPSAPGIDVRYERMVKAECATGIVGFLCREAVRWRLCKGRWNEADPGATRCRVERAGALFPPLG